MKKKLILIIVAIAAVGASVWGYTKYRGSDEKPQIVKGTVTRGNVVEAVGATGTLEAVTTVQVGTQVSGTVQNLYADFNQIVKKGQVIARLDPSLIQTQIEQQLANVIRAEADLERLKVSLEDAKTKLTRARDLSEKSLIPRTELEAAEIAVKSQEAQIRSSEAGLTQAKANLNQQRVNLNHTVIKAPIDGIVISRNVEQGQTVAASMNAPVLYLLAGDLTKMRVRASIDEADVGKIRPGQRVTFRVDAHPADQFDGTVVQVQLNPVIVQNVVTYATVIDVPNPEYRLKPGMTATVNIEIARRDNVLRIPAGATRFRPTNEIFAALNQPVPPEMAQGFGRGGRGRGGNAADGQTAQPGATSAQPGATSAAPGAQAQTPSAPQGQTAAPTPTTAPRQGETRQGQSAESRGGGDTAGGERPRGRGGFDPNMTPEERQRRMEERMKTMTPAEREEFQRRMAQRGQRGGGAGGGQQGGRGGGAAQGSGGAAAPPSRDASADRRSLGGGGQGQRTQQQSAVASGAQTIDALFAPLATTSQRGRVWMVTGSADQPQLKSINVRTGISDGQWTELIEGELQEGQEVVTGVILPGAVAQVPGTATGNPLMPQRGRGPAGPGGGGGGRGR